MLAYARGQQAKARVGSDWARPDVGRGGAGAAGGKGLECVVAAQAYGKRDGADGGGAGASKCTALHGATDPPGQRGSFIG